MRKLIIGAVVAVCLSGVAIAQDVFGPFTVMLQPIGTNQTVTPTQLTECAEREGLLAVIAVEMASNPDPTLYCVTQVQ